MIALASILPSDWFGPLPDLALLGVALVAMCIVIKAADALVEGAAGISARLGMPPIVVGATIVSLGTTSPEMGVSVLAAWSGNPGLALGNGVGSIIADTGLIFGVGCLLTRLPADRFLLTRQGWVQFGAGAGLSLWCWGKFMHLGDKASIGWPTGAVCVSLLALYLWASVRWAKQAGAAEAKADLAKVEPVPDDGALGHACGGHDHAAEKNWIALIALFLVGLAGVIVAGDGLVQSVSIVAERWGVPQVVIASTLVALGTSLPELVVGITAIRKGHPGLLVGNVIGADILNVLFVIGFASLAAPLPLVEKLPDGSVSRSLLYIQLPFMAAMLVLMRIYVAMAAKQGFFSRWMGWPLVIGYVAFVAVSALSA
ncbi:MAG: sodium:calcium antiporter [Planctomycetota bacterium]